MYLLAWVEPFTIARMDKNVRRRFSAMLFGLN